MRWGTGTRLGFFGAHIDVPLDADDGKDDHRRGFILSVSAAEPHDASLVRKFDDVAHRRRPLPAAADPPIRAGRHASD
jgi:hypothetical protein